MKNFIKTSLSGIPLEAAHGGSGQRQMLFNQDYAESTKWEAVTKAFLPVGSIFDWHEHTDSDEMFIVTRGTGKFYCEEKVLDYETGDIFLVRANTKHKIENNGKETTEGFFIRIKV